MQIYNTLTRRKEPLDPLEGGKIRMYVCGPTVYDKAHIGHAMSTIVFDVIRRYLEHRGLEVRHVMNYTDVDDKVIERAKELRVDALELAESYIEEYQQHIQDLHVLPPAVTPRASQEIPRIVEMIEQLIELGHAYELDGDVYFAVASDDDYGKLSQRRLDDMQAGARIEVDARKQHPADFALWKSAKPGEPEWDSPWGPGRPGWHIECSAMNLGHLGEQIDIHGGGNDLIFPHHENEIAQTESVTGVPFARYWVHNGMMQLGGEKMAKSEGNVLTIEAFLDEYEADVLRLLVLNSHYRGPLSFNSEIAEAARAGLDRLRSALKPANGGETDGAALREAMETARSGFTAAMEDDFSTPGALGRLYELVRAINQARDAGVRETDVQEAQTALRELAGVLGLRLDPTPSAPLDPAPFVSLYGELQARAAGAGLAIQVAPTASSNGEAALDALVELRAHLRAEKQFELADEIRVRLAELGVTLEDGAAGTLWFHNP